MSTSRSSPPRSPRSGPRPAQCWLNPTLRRRLLSAEEFREREHPRIQVGILETRQAADLEGTDQGQGRIGQEKSRNAAEQAIKIDSNNRGINGGMLDDLTIGLNWILNNNTKFQWNYDWEYLTDG